MADEVFRRNMIQRSNILAARVKYTFKDNKTGEALINCPQHGDQPEFSISVFAAGNRKVCPACFLKDFDTIKEPVRKKPAAITQYICSYKGCQATVDYHASCAYCKEFYCKDHMESEYVCDGCMLDLQGGLNDGSTRGS